MSAVELMRKAIQACRSAQLLLDTGDINGACNRARLLCDDRNSNLIQNEINYLELI